MIVIRDMAKALKKDIHIATDEIQKAINLKSTYPIIAETYYHRAELTKEKIDDAHNDLIKFIKDYRRDNEPPKEMLVRWNFVHEDLMEDVVNITKMQDMYKSL